MKKALISLILMIISISFLTGCVSYIHGSGNLITKPLSPTPKDFTSVVLSNKIDFEILRADEYSVEMSADDNLFPYIMVDKNEGVLFIELDPTENYKDIKLKVRITMPKLDMLEAQYSCNGRFTGFQTKGDFNLKLDSESSVIDSEIKADGDLKIRLDDNSMAILIGKADDLLIKVTNSSKLTMKKLPVNDANVEVREESIAVLRMDGRLKGEITGASGLYYYGSPIIEDVLVSGDSELEKMGD
jgi:hypothetical protein